MARGPRRLAGLAGALVLLALPAAATRADAPLRVDPKRVESLAGTWRFRTGDQPGWASPALDDSAWTPIAVPTGWGRQSPEAPLAWYRLTLQVGPPGVGPTTEQADRLAVALGKVDSAYELYLGGRLVGGEGRLPPDPMPNYDRHAVYPVPAGAIEPGGRLVIALRVWGSPATRSRVGGPAQGPYRVGPRHELVRAEAVAEIPELVLVAIFLLTGLIHLLVYRRRPHFREYLWFAVSTLVISAYTLLRTQWKFELVDDFVLLKKAEHVVLFVLAPAFAQFVWLLFDLPQGRVVRGYQAANLAGGAVVLASSNLVLNLRLVRTWQWALLAFTAYGLVVVARRVAARWPEDRTVVAGLVPLIAAYVSDLAVDQGWYQARPLVPFGFALFVLVMVVALAARFSRVHAALTGLHRDLEDRIRERTRELEDRTAELARINRDLEDRTAQLHEVSGAKTAFLAGLSHEIRTPVTGVIGMAHLLLGTPLSQTQREYAEAMRDSGQALLDLVGGVLDLSKVEAGKLELHAADFDPRALLAGTTRILIGAARQKGLDLTCRLDRSLPPRVRGDAARLRQVVGNLVANAVKFTRHGHVELRARAERTDPGWRLHVEVEDTGIGIPPEFGDSIFEPYAQAPAAAPGHVGTGLGLAIARRLVEAQGGEIGYRSQPGRGSTFWFHVVLAEPRGVAAAGPAPPAPAARILLAEDSSVAAAVVSGLLRAQGHTVDVVPTGREAVDAVRRGGYDAVLMDCQMPEMDGYAAAAAIRSGETGRRVPIIALTASALSGDRERCLAAGMDDHLAKPVGPEDLRAILARHLPDAGAPEAPPATPPVASAGPIGSKPAAAAEQLVDPAVLADLQAHVGPATLGQWIDDLLRDLPNRFDELRRLWRARDPDFHRRVHGLKGTCGLLGARRLAALCREADDDYRAGRPVDGEALVDALDRALAPTAAALRTGLGGASA